MLKLFSFLICENLMRSLIQLSKKPLIYATAWNRWARFAASNFMDNCDNERKLFLKRGYNIYNDEFFMTIEISDFVFFVPCSTLHTHGTCDSLFFFLMRWLFTHNSTCNPVISDNIVTTFKWVEYLPKRLSFFFYLS